MPSCCNVADLNWPLKTETDIIPIICCCRSNVRRFEGLKDSTFLPSEAKNLSSDYPTEKNVFWVTGNKGNLVLRVVAEGLSFVLAVNNGEAVLKT